MQLLGLHLGDLLRRLGPVGRLHAPLEEVRLHLPIPGVHLLLHLGQRPGLFGLHLGPLLLVLVAELQQPRQFLERFVQRLERFGLLLSVLGPGGFLLLLPADHVVELLLAGAVDVGHAVLLAAAISA